MGSRKKFHQDFEAEKSNPDVVKLPQFILLLLLSEVRLFYTLILILHPSAFSPIYFSKIRPLGKEIESHTGQSWKSNGEVLKSTSIWKEVSLLQVLLYSSTVDRAGLGFFPITLCFSACRHPRAIPLRGLRRDTAAIHVLKCFT